MARTTISMPLKERQVKYTFLVQNEEGNYLVLIEGKDPMFVYYQATVFENGTEAVEFAKVYKAKVLVLEQTIDSSMPVDIIDPNVSDAFTTDLLPEEQIENLPEHVLKVEYEVDE